MKARSRMVASKASNSAAAALACRRSFCEEGCFWGGQLDRPARNRKHAFSLMMNRPWPLPARINPRLDHLQDEKVVLVDQFSINHLAFQTGITLGDERGLDDRRGHRREAKGCELVH